MSAPEPWTAAHIQSVLARFNPDTAASASSARQAAVAMILHERAPGDIHVLFIQRAEHPEDPWSGHMAFPGGRKDPGDATLAAAAERETLEEVGLALTPDMRLGRLDDFKAGRLITFDLALASFVYLVPDPGELSLNEEVADAVWVPLAHLADTANVLPYSFALDDTALMYPAFHFGPYIIWGLTYRVVASYMELFGIRLPLVIEEHLAE